MLHTTPSGLLIIDKPQGVTSFDAVAAVRGALHIKKVGHAGTLDPMATGTLVIAFGHATRLLNAIVAHDKTYEATIRLGLRTTTDDAEGEVLLTSISGKPRDWSAAALLGAFLRMPFLTLGVIARIHWQALKLWLKGVPFRGAHPATQPLQEPTK